MEETENKPKPMTLISGKPILLHIMEIFSSQGFHEFVIALGYRGEVVKRWLADLVQLDGDIKVSLSDSSIERKKSGLNSKLNIFAMDTGINTQTGGRIAQCMDEFPGETVLATYGDGLANVNLQHLIRTHNASGKLATVTAVRPPARFGHLRLNENLDVESFGEKNQSDEGWINGGFFVLQPEVRRFIHSDSEPFETGALPRLVAENQLGAFPHGGFWQPMDTLREKLELEKLATLTPPPWLTL